MGDKTKKFLEIIGKEKYKYADIRYIIRNKKTGDTCSKWVGIHNHESLGDVESKLGAKFVGMKSNENEKEYPTFKRE
jgi:hypothetical protein